MGRQTQCIFRDLGPAVVSTAPRAEALLPSRPHLLLRRPDGAEPGLLEAPHQALHATHRAQWYKGTAAAMTRPLQGGSRHHQPDTERLPASPTVIRVAKCYPGIKAGTKR